MANVAWKPGAWVGTAWNGTVWYADSSGKSWWTDAWVADAWYGTAWATNAAATVDYSINAQSGNYAVTGQTVVTNITMPAGVGEYAYTGDDALRDFLLQTVPITTDNDYVLTGEDTGGGLGIPMAADTGFYLLVGQDANLDRGKFFDAQFEHYIVSMGTPTFTFGVGTFISGTFTLTGIDANLLLNIRMSADTGYYTAVGSDDSLIFGEFIYADYGTYDLTGQDATFFREYRLDATTGYYDSNGGQARTPREEDEDHRRHAGHGGKKKKRDEEPRKRVIEIDGEEFVVDTEEEAIAILSAVKDIAEQKAKEDATAQVTSRLKSKAAAIDTSPIDLSIPTVLGNDAAFQAQVGKVIEEAYKRAEIEAEVAVRLAKQRLLDEEDNLVLLLLNQ